MIDALEAGYYAWLLEWKADFLTTFFRLFPYLVSDYFFIAVIALGFWLNPASRLFQSLGFLVPFSALLNCILKDLFRIPRPDPSTHLITVAESFGFPSGDVQVGSVFWISIMLSLKPGTPQKLCLIPVVGIAVSRYYLGVHSIPDVVGGLMIGLATLYIWHTTLEKRIFVNWKKTTTEVIHVEKAWYLLIAMTALYGMVSLDVIWSHISSISIGALFGFCCYLQARQSLGPKLSSPFSLMAAAISLLTIVALVKLIPIMKVTPIAMQVSLIFKYAFIFFATFVAIPTIYHRLMQRRSTVSKKIIYDIPPIVLK